MFKFIKLLLDSTLLSANIKFQWKSLILSIKSNLMFHFCYFKVNRLSLGAEILFNLICKVVY